jgi:Serine aminopeptidase, S33
MGRVKVFVRSWRPEGAAKGVLVIVHGFNAHSGHYEWVAQQFTDTGLAAYAPDLCSARSSALLDMLRPQLGWPGHQDARFGAMGFILGPILAALVVTAWEVLARRSAARSPNRLCR